MHFKQDTPQDTVETLKALEDRADRCCENLELYSFPRGTASWAVLSSLVIDTERARQEQGYKNYDARLINLSRRGALALQWVQERGLGTQSDPNTYRMNNSLARAVNQALATAANYRVFLGCFPLWHQNRLLGELVSDSRVRFMLPGGEAARRVSAFQMGFRAESTPAQDETLTPTAEQENEINVALSRCFYSGDESITYPEPIELYGLLFHSYLDRLSAMFRRVDSLDLGPYTLGELKRAYAAITTVLSTHEDLCYRFGLKYRYPVNSCVMTRTRDRWANLFSRIADLEESKCNAIVEDLTNNGRVWDLHVQPFVPVDDNMLAIAPQFPLHSRADENILRVCGDRRRRHADEAYRLKEQEMLDDLLPTIPERFNPQNCIHLPRGLPDIDLLLSDEHSSTVTAIESKWLRKPSSDWNERIHREQDFKKGIQQLSDIKEFLTQNPSFLPSRGKLKRPIDEYQEISFLLVARDFFLWPGPNACIVTDYEVFKHAVSQATDLGELTNKLRSYDWLPVEGKNFRVSVEPVMLNGAILESETFYRT